MRFKYSTLAPTPEELDYLPHIPLLLFKEEYSLTALGLVDSGAMVNILPFEAGLKLGAKWDNHQAILNVGGGLNRQKAMPLLVMAKVAGFSPVKLAFGWVRSNNVPIILGQMNFFMKFDVCFYRSQNEFEVKPKSTNA